MYIMQEATPATTNESLPTNQCCAKIGFSSHEKYKRIDFNIY